MGGVSKPDDGFRPMHPRVQSARLTAERLINAEPKHRQLLITLAAAMRQLWLAAGRRVPPRGRSKPNKRARASG